jgi:hypothetical protein
MQNDLNLIAQQLFNKEDAGQVNDDELEQFISKYPYVAATRFLHAAKKYNRESVEAAEEVITAGLFFNNPLWLSAQLNDDETQIKEEAPAAGPEQPKTEEELPLAFQSYHTIDYFASQGIRLQQAELTKDKLGQQLKSFTEWLRSMKKLPDAEGQAGAPEDDTRQKVVIQDAASSIAEKEVVTEAMAEVWLKQGNNAKAAEIYHKLSLLNPSKSSYFAAKIDQLK